MSEYNNKELEQIRNQLNDIHKLMFNPSPVKTNEDNKNKIKAEILLGVKKRRLPPQH